MGLSRNKVAVPEGAAGTPPFWRRSPGKETSSKKGTLITETQGGKQFYLIEGFIEVFYFRPKGASCTRNLCFNIEKKKLGLSKSELKPGKSWTDSQDLNIVL